MKYVPQLVIEIPLNICAKKFNATEKLKHRQRGLVSVDYSSGTPRAFGAKINILFKIGKNV